MDASALDRRGLHAQRVQDGRLRRGKAGGQVIGHGGIHQEPHRSAVDAIYRQVAPQRRMQHFQHEAIATQTDQRIRFLRGALAVLPDQTFQPQLRAFVRGRGKAQLCWKVPIGPARVRHVIHGVWMDRR